MVIYSGLTYYLKASSGTKHKTQTYMCLLDCVSAAMEPDDNTPDENRQLFLILVYNDGGFLVNLIRR